MRTYWMVIASLVLASCAATGPYVADRIVWEDPDRRPIKMPEENWLPNFWDVVDQTVFRPLSDAFAARPAEPARNVNALGEVPNSSWYTNRLSVRHLSPKRLAQGPCRVPPFDQTSRLDVVSSKLDGVNPGMIIQDQRDGERYVLKFESANGTEASSTADVVGSRLYWAAGFSTPCNRVDYLELSRFRMTDSAVKKDDFGNLVPLSRSDIDDALTEASVDDRGRVRVMASHFLPGVPLGPFEYDGTRAEDPNDVIPHQHRRELRASRLIAAWLHHYDARPHNTYTSFIETGQGRGYVQHHMLDFGDSLGSSWVGNQFHPRFGHAYYFDFGQVTADTLTFGLVRRPWDRTRQERPDPSWVWGYYDVDHFDPATWKAGYPNAAFVEMQPADGWWMTGIIGRISDAHLDAIVAEAKMTDPAHRASLLKILRGRRDRIVRHYFGRWSSLVWPRIRGDQLCLEDRMVAAGYAKGQAARYELRVDDGNFARVAGQGTEVCVPVPEGASVDLDLRVQRTGQDKPAVAVRVRLRRVSGKPTIAGFGLMAL